MPTPEPLALAEVPDPDPNEVTRLRRELRAATRELGQLRARAFHRMNADLADEVARMTRERDIARDNANAHHRTATERWGEVERLKARLAWVRFLAWASGGAFGGLAVHAGWWSSAGALAYGIAAAGAIWAWERWRKGGVGGA